MKRMATLFLSVVFLLCLFGCDDSNASSSSSSTSTSTSTSSSSSTSGQSAEESGDSSQHVFYETDDRKRKSILTDASDYEVDDSEARYTSAELYDIVYHGLGRSYRDVLNYSGRSDDPSYVGFGDHGMSGTYYTHFDNLDANRHMLFRTSSSTYFNDNDYCYGANGWLERVFDYEKTQGPCNARAFADILGAKNTYTISSWPEEYYVPTNLDSSGLYVIEADLDTASGVCPCTILLEADSDSYYIGGDSWVEVIVNKAGGAPEEQPREQASEQEVPVEHTPSQPTNTLASNWEGNYEGVYARQDGSEYTDTRTFYLNITSGNNGGSISGTCSLDTGESYYIEGSYDASSGYIVFSNSGWIVQKGTNSYRTFKGYVSGGSMHGSTTTTSGGHYSDFSAYAS